MNRGTLKLNKTLFAFSVYMLGLILTCVQPAFCQDDYQFDLSEIEKEIEKKPYYIGGFLGSGRFFSAWIVILPSTSFDSLIKTKGQPWNNIILVFASREAIRRALRVFISKLTVSSGTTIRVGTGTLLFWKGILH